SGWPSTMTPAIASAIPNHTAAFCISRRTSGSRNSAGPGRSTCGSTVGGGLAIAALAIPQRAPGAPVTKGPDPADRVPPLGRTVEGEGDELGAPTDILPRHRRSESTVPGADRAVGRLGAVVAPQ